MKLRIWSLDLARGLYILAMMLAHTIFFFHSRYQPVLNLANSIVDHLAFSGLLFFSGISGYLAYIHRGHPNPNVIGRVVKRLLIYLVGYYTIANLIDFLTGHFSSSNLVGIVTFQRLIPFTEFILPFIFIGLLKIPFRRIFDFLTQSLVYLIFTSILIYSLSIALALFPHPYLFGWFKSVLFGSLNSFSFPVFTYLPLYLFGVYLGRHYFEGHHKDQRQSYFLKLTFILFALAVISYSLGSISGIYAFAFHRFPPSLPFLLLGAAIGLLILWLLEAFHNLIHLPWIRNLLLIFGQNTFALFFTHTLILYTLAYFKLPTLHSSLLIGLLFIFTVLLALYFARILPLNYRFQLTFIKWYDYHLHAHSHFQEHRYILKLKRLLLGFINLPMLFSLKIGRRRFYPLKPRSLGVALGLLILTATPLGIAENYFAVTQIIGQSQGTTNRRWYLPQFNSEIIYSYTLPDTLTTNPQKVSYLIDNTTTGKMSNFDQTWTARIAVNRLEPGEYQLRTLITLNQQEISTQPTTIYVSQPVYVTWTIDWEGYDVADAYLDAMINLSQAHSVPMTHLFNPRIYTAPDIPTDRADYLTRWVINRRDLHNEEIGLHLHMFKDFVASAGLEPKTEPAWSDGSGYDILTTAYNQTEMETILNHAKDWFTQKNLGAPVSYRAGAWFANLDTLKALEATGFLLDSSGRTAYSFGNRQIPGFWDLTSTTPPYFPSIFNQNQTSPQPQLSLLEIPNNGADDYAFSGTQMLERFQANYSGGVSTQMKQVTFLSHPQWLNPDRQAKINLIFNHINRFDYAQDTGPVIKTTLKGVYQAWVQ